MAEEAIEAPAYKQTTFANMNFEAPAEETPAPEVPAETAAVDNTETPAAAAVETPAEQPTTPAPVEENVSTFNLTFDGAQPTAEIKTEEKPAPTVYNWKEEIKKLDPKEVAKELGLNDFALEINEYLSKGGKAEDYLNAKAIDYGQVSDEELIKDDYKKQFPNLTKDEINRLYNRKYGVTEDMLDDEKEDRLIQLKADGHIKRQSKIQEQQTFKIPDTPILQKDEAYEQWKHQQESLPAAMEQLKNFYVNHDVTKNLNESKRVAVSLGDGVAPFNFSVDQPEVLTKMFTDGGEIWQKVTSTKTGEPDVQKQHLIGLFSFNPEKFMKDIFNYGKQMGVRSKVEEGQNAQKPQAKVLPPELNGNVSYATGKFGDRQRN